MSFGDQNTRSRVRIISKKQQTFAGFVEPAHRSKPWGVWRQERVHRVAALFIRSGGYYATRLVENEINLWLGGQALRSPLDTVRRQVHGRFRIAADRAVQGDLPGADQFRGARARTVAELGHRAGQSYFSWLFRRGHRMAHEASFPAASEPPRGFPDKELPATTVTSSSHTREWGARKKTKSGAP